MPTIITSGAANARALSSNGVSGAFYMGHLLGTTTQGTSILRQAAEDPQGNTYFVGLAGTSNANINVVALKVDSFGNTVWQKNYAGTSNSTTTYGSRAVYANGYVYTTVIDFASGNKTGYLKIDASNGNIAAQVSTIVNSVASNSASELAVDSSDNVYLLLDNCTVVKYNSSGTAQWAQTVTWPTNVFPADATSFVGGVNMILDSAGNIYCLGQILGNFSGNYYYGLFKYNSSGTLQWQKVFNGVNNTNFSRQNNSIQVLSIDQFNNIYIIGAGSASLFNPTILKFDTSGNCVFQTYISQYVMNVLYSSTCDLFGNVYLLGQAAYANQDGPYGVPLLIKLTSTGTVVWARCFNNSGVTTFPGINSSAFRGVAAVGQSVYLVGNTTLAETATLSGNGNAWQFYKIPADGSLFGQYQTDAQFVSQYSNALKPITATTGSLITVIAGAGTFASGSIATASPALTASTGGFSNYIKKLVGPPYTISRSVRLRSSASAYLSDTFGAPTSSTIFTWSGWVKRGALGTTSYLFGASTTTNFGFNSGDQLVLTLAGTTAVTTTAVYRDPSAWYHIVYTQNGAAQTLYVNGNVAGTGTTANTVFNTAIAHQIGAANTTNYFDGYLTEINFVDGQALTPSSFGFSAPITSQWQPIRYDGTYGANGFYINFSDNSGVTATTIGKDYSGNGNNWTPNNISITTGATYDSMLDVPVAYYDGAYGRGNYSVLNPLAKSVAPLGTLTNGNLSYSAPGSANYSRAVGSMQFTISVSTVGGSYGLRSNAYFEVTITAGTLQIGIIQINDVTASYPGFSPRGYVYDSATGTKVNNNLSEPFGASATVGDVIGVEVAGSSIIFYKNGTALGVAYSSMIPATGNSWYYVPVVGNSSTSVTSSCNINFGQRPFVYPNTSVNTYPREVLNTLTWLNQVQFRALNSANSVAATVYTGTGSSLAVTNTVNNSNTYGDLVWIKGISGATDNVIYDSSRGTTKELIVNSAAAETTQATGVTAFSSTGFTVGSLARVNTASATYLAWQWRMGTGQTKTQTAVSTNLAVVNQFNPLGICITTYTGNATAAALVRAQTTGDQNPIAFIIVKARSAANAWTVYHKDQAASSPQGGYLSLNSTAGYTAGTTVWNNTSPTTTDFTVGTSALTNGSGVTYVAYTFATVSGQSMYSVYLGNGSADGPFVDCGFKPKMILVKRVDSTSNWFMWDSTRSPINVGSNTLYADLANAADTSTVAVDFLSNGFKIRSATLANVSGGRYVFAAWAENSFAFGNAV
jgi:hypothetical protein